MSGQSRLTVVEFRRGAKNAHPTAVCVCECGNERIARQTDLRRGRVIECASCVIKTAWRIKPRRSERDRAFADLWDTYKQNARRRAITFYLSKDVVFALVTAPCHYCGVSKETFGGIDRMDNKRGYEAGNAVPCCDQCNYAKREMTVEEFLSWADRVSRHQRERITTTTTVPCVLG